MNNEIIYRVRTKDGGLSEWTLEDLSEAFRDGRIHDDALVTTNRQDSWYGLGELLGPKQTPPLNFPCPKCKAVIKGRRIDMGMHVVCGTCGREVVVPDVNASRELAAKKERVRNLKASVFRSAVVLCFGLFMTIGSYCFAVSGGMYFVFYGAIAYGAGTLMANLPEYLRSKKALDSSPGDARPLVSDRRS